MRTALNIDTWNRKDHFQFFKQFEEPFFGVTVSIECTQAYEQAKAMEQSFFLYYLYQSLRAANAVEAFRYRINGEEVWLYDQVHASPTINRPDGTFGFSYIDYHTDEAVYFEKAKQEIERVQNSQGLQPAVSGENVIHYSSLPWLNFTAISHARSFSFKDSCPKISFGKMTISDGKKWMPVSIHVHHALVDGFQVGQFVELFQENMGLMG